MAFAKGTPIDPRLRAIDFSPASEATDTIIKGYQSMGKSIDDAIIGLQEEREKKKEEKVRRESIDFVLQGANLPKEYKKGTPGYDALLKTLEKEEDFLSSIESVIDLQGGGAGILYSESELLEGRSKGLNIKGQPTGQRNEKGEMMYKVTEDIGTYAPNVKEIVSSEDPFLELGFESFVKPLVENAANSSGRIQTANTGIDLLTKEDFETGIGQDLIVNLKGLGNTFFGTDFDISNQELFRNQIEPTMMNFIQNTKGAISDREMAKFASWSPSLEKTKDGNIKILLALRKGAENQQASMKLLSQLRSQGITDPYEINRRINDFLMLPENQVVDYVNREFDKIKKGKTSEPQPNEGSTLKTNFTSVEEIENLDTSNYKDGDILYLNGKPYGAVDNK